MRIEKVVINSSPLIVLFRSGQADLLPQLFKSVVVPEQVYEEVTAGEKDKHYQTKQIEAYAVYSASECLVITVLTKFF